MWSNVLDIGNVHVSRIGVDSLVDRYLVNDIVIKECLCIESIRQSIRLNVSILRFPVYV